MPSDEIDTAAEVNQDNFWSLVNAKCIFCKAPVSEITFNGTVC